MIPISLGLPVYNGDRYLRDCLDSILAQTMGDFELVISDNASTDKTAEICREYAARDRRIRVVTHPENIGAAGNFNFLFHDTKGEYFKWCAHDDLMEPAFLEKTHARLQADRAAVLSHSYTTVFSDDGQNEELFKPDFATDPADPVARLREVMLHGRRCYEVFGLIRRDALARTDLIGNHKGGDNVLLYRLALLGTFAIVPEPLFRLRRHAAQSTALLMDSQAYQRWFTGRSQKMTFPDWHMVRQIWKTPAGIGLSAAQRLRCLGPLLGETWRRRARLRQNLRVAAEILVFGSADPQRRRRLFRQYDGS
ncbi:glycosyltransferase family 2 protein [Rhodobacter sp. Har01]|uniref:glycosyltransferase family 2 protein n=1 Tax=Rhodobacter sp. Har01 TaxID=2883999 RepID=UPI001D077CCD|nr:glycosyltransferase family A protein [Rhodobacter sp. Har01]MCB6179841.1 glycosyltransferase family 2 protein [Rhodobacter sp. Har01]